MPRASRSSPETKSLTPIRTARERRKLISFDAETWRALDQLARDSMKSIQELADEAFADILKKYRRPTDLRQALRDSARLAPANDARPHPRRKSSKSS